MDINTHIDNAIAAGNNGDWQQSHEHYEKAFALDANHPKVTNGLGIAAFALGYVDESIGRYMATLGNTNDPESLMVAHNGIGIGFYQKKQFEDALRHYEKAHVINPFNAQVLAGLGLTHQQLGNINEARQAFLQMRKVDAHSTLPLVGLAQIAMKEGNIPIARGYLEMALKVEPGNTYVQQLHDNLPPATGRKK